MTTPTVITRIRLYVDVYELSLRYVSLVKDACKCDRAQKTEVGVSGALGL